MTIPPVNTVGKEFPLNHLADLLCEEVARAGYIQMVYHYSLFLSLSLSLLLFVDRSFSCQRQSVYQ